MGLASLSAPTTSQMPRDAHDATIPVLSWLAFVANVAIEVATARTEQVNGGKKIDGRKRHIATDTQGLLLAVLVTAASMQDCSAARPLLRALHQAQTAVWADGG